MYFHLFNDLYVHLKKLVDKSHYERLWFPTMILFYFRYDDVQVTEMKRCLKPPGHGGSVHVTFNVSKVAAGNIRQAAVDHWKRLQDLGVVSVELDKELLVSSSPEPCTEFQKTESTELWRRSRRPYPLSGSVELAEFTPVFNCRGSRGGKRNRCSGSRARKRMRSDDALCPSDEPRFSSAKSAAQADIMGRIGNNQCPKFNQDNAITPHSNEHALLTSAQRVPFSRFPCHLPSSVEFTHAALNTGNHAMSEKTHLTAETWQFKLVEGMNETAADIVQSRALPPPSTPLVPKCRKRRKPAERCPETVSANPPCADLDRMNHVVLPVNVTGSVMAASKLCRQNRVNSRFPLNGHYLQQFNSPVYSQYTVSNSQPAPFRYANSRNLGTLQFYSKLPLERPTVPDASRSVSQSADILPAADMEPKDVGVMFAQGNERGCCNQMVQPLIGSNLSCSVGSQLPQLCQPVVTVLSRDILNSRYPNPETSDAAKAIVADCSEKFCDCVNDRLCAVSCPVSAENNLFPQVDGFDSALGIKPAKSKSPLAAELNHTVESPKLKLSGTVFAGSVEVIGNVQCSSAESSVVSATSVYGCSSSGNSVVKSQVVENSMPVSSSEVAEKQKTDVVNGYHFPSDRTCLERLRTSNKLTSPAALIDSKPSHYASVASSDAIGSTIDLLLPAVDHSSDAGTVSGIETSEFTCWL